MKFLPETTDFFKKIKLTSVLILWLEENHSHLQSDADDLYHRFFIQEKNKQREIEAPCESLRRIQRLLMEKFFYRFRPSACVHGFVNRKSPKTNAAVHLAQWLKKPDQFCILTVDIKGFFHAIKTASVMELVAGILDKKFSMSSESKSEILECITSLCLRNGRLPMGAPTSPAISNLIFRRLDEKFYMKAYKTGLVYTRYADDLTVSGPQANDMYPYIEEQCLEQGFTLNDRKTRVLRPHRRMAITGITINSGELTVSRKFRRRLRAQVHQTELVGAKVTPLPGKEIHATSLLILQGQASWVASVNSRHSGLKTRVDSIRRATVEGP